MLTRETILDIRHEMIVSGYINQKAIVGISPLIDGLSVMQLATHDCSIPMKHFALDNYVYGPQIVEMTRLDRYNVERLFRLGWFFDNLLCRFGIDAAE